MGGVESCCNFIISIVLIMLHIHYMLAKTRTCPDTKVMLLMSLIWLVSRPRHTSHGWDIHRKIIWQFELSWVAKGPIYR